MIRHGEALDHTHERHVAEELSVMKASCDVAPMHSRSCSNCTLCPCDDMDEWQRRRDGQPCTERCGIG